MEKRTIVQKKIVEQPSKYLKIIAIFYTAGLIIYTTIDFLYREKFYKMSEELTILARKGNNSSIVFIYNWTFSRPLYAWLPILPIFYLISLPNKKNSIFYFCLYWINFTLRNTLMIIFREPRPNWTIQQNIGLECKCGYGKPSGHSTRSTMGYLILLYNFVLISKKSVFFKFFFSFLYYWIVLSIMWSRIYFGAHTFSQVIIGHLFSCSLFYLAILFQKKIKEKILNFLKNPQKNLKKNIFLWLGFYGLTTGIWIIEHIIHKRDRDLGRNPYIKGRCPKCFDVNSINSFDYKILYSIGFGVQILGLILGIGLRSVGYLERIEERWSWVRVGVKLCILGIFELPLLIVSLIPFRNHYLKAVSYHVCMLFGTFGMMYFGFDVMKKIGFYDRELLLLEYPDECEGASITGVSEYKENFIQE